MDKLYGNNNRNKLKSFLMEIKPSYCIVSIIGSVILAFGLYNIHAVSGVTEGGVLGMTLLLEYWFDISPAISGFVLSALCYILGWKVLGKKFIFYSAISSGGFSIAYSFFEQFPPLFPEIANMPVVATVVGAIFVGVSAGMCVRVGGAPSGDDALAMSLAKALHCNIERIYLISDLVVLLLSLSYIPLDRITYSLITVILSGQIIGVVVRIKIPKIKRKKSKESEDKGNLFIS